MIHDPAHLFVSLFLPFLLEGLSQLLQPCLQAQTGSWGCPQGGILRAELVLLCADLDLC